MTTRGVCDVKARWAQGARAAEEAYARTVLRKLDEAQRGALDRYAARALDDPAALPADEGERAAVAAADRLAVGEGPRTARHRW